jgi:hypothetical protein
MKRIFFSFILIFSLLVICQTAAKAQNWVIVPGRSVGQIRAGTSERDLIKIYGRKNVKRAEINVGEGETVQGTILFPNQPRQRAFVLWKDAATRQNPESISIRDKNTFWKTSRGITMGTTLRTIEKLNGRAFALTGFGWDYSGTVLHSNGGILKEFGIEKDDEISGRTLILRLEPAASLRRTRQYQSVLGDKQFLSNNRAMRFLNPRVYEIIVEFSR